MLENLTFAAGCLIERQLGNYQIDQIWSAGEKIRFRLSDGRIGDVEVFVNLDAAPTCSEVPVVPVPHDPQEATVEADLGSHFYFDESDFDQTLLLRCANLRPSLLLGGNDRCTSCSRHRSLPPSGRTTQPLNLSEPPKRAKRLVDSVEVRLELLFLLF